MIYKMYAFSQKGDISFFVGEIGLNQCAKMFLFLGRCASASQAGDADSSRALGLTSGLQGSVNVNVVLYCLCHSDSASVLL